MSDCLFQNQLSAFYDGELDAHTAAGVASHVEGCVACRDGLAAMSAVSRLMHTAAEGRMSQMGLARLHATADASARRTDIFPLTRVLGAVAASVLIITGAWLTQTPRRLVAPTSVSIVRPQADWEVLASGGTLAAPKGLESESRYAFAEWIVKNLKQKSKGS